VRIAVTGASGRLGGQVAGLLAAGGEHEVVAVSRRPGPPTASSRGVSVAVADYADPAALRAAFRGAEKLVFISSDGEAVNVLRHHENVVRAAAAARIGHIVALSGLDADPGSPFCYAVTYGYTEQMLHDSGCAVSIARAASDLFKTEPGVHQHLRIREF
jgi:NAD(P)H dehydrogenase (quinone)